MVRTLLLRKTLARRLSGIMFGVGSPTNRIRFRRSAGFVIGSPDHIFRFIISLYIHML
jgi:hypothetical protein